VARTTLVWRARFFVAIHTEAHFETGLMDPSIAVGKFFVASRARNGRVICMTKNNIRCNPVNTDPLNLCRVVFIGMALPALQRRWKRLEFGPYMTGGTGNLFLHVLSMGKFKWLTNRGGPTKIDKGHQ